MSQKKESLSKNRVQKKVCFLTLITTFGIRKNAYADLVEAELTMDDLF